MDEQLQRPIDQEQMKTEAVTRFMCTANHGFAPYAQEELRRIFGSVKSQVLVPGEVFLASLPGFANEIIAKLMGEPPIFLRHMFPAEWQFPAEAGEEEPAESAVQALVQFAEEELRLRCPDTRAAVTVQVRKGSDSIWSGSALELKEKIEGSWAEDSVQFVVRDADYILSVFAGGPCIYAGISKPEQNLSDWNGGAVRFQREEGQISRAKFKLLEAERTFGIDFAGFSRALDIGAAPGGWTSFLLERGLSVTAVDPAKMHPDLLANPRLTYLGKNADSVKFQTNEFDLLVCDMSWSPKLTARLVIDLLYSLVPGGTAVVTIKLLSKKPMALIKEITAMYLDARMQIVQAKQLFHNRDEITLYMIKY
ncbi:SAM-dependent methyltransferase [Paenibacillus caui]|uniref:SAM-dependent methyltransferase n=1 Tax=Paenibacillus caui TaxID=2873927 RepID=UPI001CA7C30A|nr:SAM-dependent methyltransferase [Paenibacillus caui]